MTKCTARELLDELATTGKCDQCGDRIGESEEYGIYCGCRHHRPCRHRWRTGDGCSICELTQDISCDAEKAVLVEALQMLWDYHGQRLDDAIPSGCNAAEFAKKWPLTDAQLDKKVRDALANTSPSALLAQAQWLKRLVDRIELDDFHIKESEVFKGARAALAPGEEKQQ